MRVRDGAAVLLLWVTGCRAGLDATFPPARPTSRAAVETSGAGWIRVDAGALISSGLPADAPLGSLSVSREGRAVSYLTERTGQTLADAEALLFWTEPATSRWTDVAVYWVTDGGDDATPIGVRSVGAASSAGTALRTVERTALEKFYVLSLQNGPATNFVWDGVVATSAPAAKDFLVGASRPLASGSFSLTLELHALSFDDAYDPDHHVVIEVNGNPIGEASFDGLGDREMTVTGPAAWILAGENRITVRLPHDTGAARDTVLVRAITLDHPRVAATDAPAAMPVVVADTPGAYVFDGVPAGTRVYDLADPFAPVRLAGADPFAPPGDDDDDGTPEPPRVEIVADHAPARLLLVPPGAARAPLAVRASRDTHALLDRSNVAELLVVTPADLAPAADRLAEHRATQGISTKVVLWDDVVDAFGEGIPSPDAIANLVRSARESPMPPRWLLVFGDASHDPKELLSAEEPSGNRIPAFFDDAAELMESPSDNGFVADSARSRPELAVGRIPAATLDEADAVVDKLIAYDAAPLAAYSSKVVLAADNGVEAWEIDLFEQTSETVASILPGSLASERVYIGDLGAATARTTLLAELAEGALWVNYLGHGNYTEWAAEKLFADDDIAALPEQDVLPVYTVMNCLSGHFSQPNWKLRSMGEQLVLAPRRGAVAVIASSALAYPGGQPELDLALVQRLLADTDAPTLGEALMQAKQLLDPANADQGDVILAWHLLGDPSMRLKRP